MSKSHTPGPWKTYFTDMAVLPGWVVKADNLTETPIALVSEPQGGKKGGDGLSPVQKANARLIAAAPELLEALLNARSTTKELMQTVILGEQADMVTDELLRIEAAIAKAKGE